MPHTLFNTPGFFNDTNSCSMSLALCRPYRVLIRVTTHLPPSKRKEHQYTYWNKELLDFFHGVSHQSVRFTGGPKNLDEDMQIHVQMSIFRISPFTQFFLLKQSTLKIPKAK